MSQPLLFGFGPTHNFGTATGAHLEDGDSDDDGDVDGNDFLNWQRNYSGSASLGAAVGSSADSEATDAVGGAFFSTTGAAAGVSNGATAAWIDLPLFQSQKARFQHRPFHRDLAVDDVMSRLDTQTPRVDLKHLHETATDTAFATVPTEYDDMARFLIRRVDKARHGDAPADLTNLEAAFDELRTDNADRWCLASP